MADIKISALSQVSEVQSTDVVPVVSGNSTMKMTAAQVKDYCVGDLDVSDNATAGSYVTAVSETDGVIEVTREVADTTPTASSKKMLTSGGAKTALDAKMSYADNGVLGAKNLLPYPYSYPSQALSGITYTEGTDGSIAISGTHNAGETKFYLYSKSDLLLETGKTYIMSCGVVISNSYITLLVAKFYDSSNNSVGTYSIPNNGTADYVQFTVPSNATSMEVYIYIAGAQTLNATIYPMIRLASDTDNTYQPYAMTNRELTELETFETYTVTCTLSDISQDVTFIKKGNEVRFSTAPSFGNGTAFSSATGDDTLATLPSDLRPKVQTVFVGAARNAATWASATYYPIVIDVRTNGALTLRGNVTNLQSCNYVTFSGSYFTN